MRFLIRNPPFKQKSRVFFSEIPLLIGYHVIYLRESHIYAHITRFLFGNPPFKRKSSVFSSETPDLIKYQQFHLRESHIQANITRFLFRKPQVSENHEFSPRKSPI